MTCGDTTKGHPIHTSLMNAVEPGTIPHPLDELDGRTPGTVAEGVASHFSEGKSGVDQIPVEVLIEWGDIFTMGAAKYGRDNWKGGTDWHEFYGSALRHIFKFWNGEDIDEESGLPHLAHAIWNLATIRYYQLHELGKDTRDVRSHQNQSS